MACHILGAPNMALMLGAPTSVECVMQEGKSSFMFPKKSIIRFDFPQRGNMPPVKIFWHDGMTEPPAAPEGLSQDEILGDLPRAPREGQPAPERKGRLSNNGSLFIGDKGFITTGTYGEGTRLVPSDRMKDYKLPIPSLKRAPASAKSATTPTGFTPPRPVSRPTPISPSPARSPNGSCSGTLALRFEGKLEWDSEKMRTNNAEANKLIKPAYRKGWTLGKDVVSRACPLPYGRGSPLGGTGEPPCGACGWRS